MKEINNLEDLKSLFDKPIFELRLNAYNFAKKWIEIKVGK